MDGQPEGGYTGMFEIICCDCGDHPGLGYREVPLVAKGRSSRNANGTMISKNSMDDEDHNGDGLGDDHAAATPPSPCSDENSRRIRHSRARHTRPGADHQALSLRVPITQHVSLSPGRSDPLAFIR
jgi:hypothetical protein